jgi:hypothetical protein
LKGIAMPNDEGVAMVIVNVRLHKNLKNYAAKNRVPLAAVLRRVRPQTILDVRRDHDGRISSSVRTRCFSHHAKNWPIASA